MTLSAPTVWATCIPTGRATNTDKHAMISAHGAGEFWHTALRAFELRGVTQPCGDEAASDAPGQWFGGLDSCRHIGIRVDKALISDFLAYFTA